MHPISPPEIVIRPIRGWRFLDLRELWQYRELVGFFAWRDIKVRYKQTVIGVAWVMLQPLLMMLVFWFFFGKLGGMESGLHGVPYPLFALLGLLPWQFFSRVAGDAGGSIVAEQRLISKIYFPRVIVPISIAMAALIDLLVGVGLVAASVLWFGLSPGVELIFVPLFILLMLATTMGVSFWLSALNTEYRDVMYATPFFLQLWMFVTPVVYPVSMVPIGYRWMLGLNPMAGVVEGFRWSFGAGGEPPGPLLWVSVGVAGAIFLSGIAWFRYREHVIVDTLAS